MCSGESLLPALHLNTTWFSRFSTEFACTGSLSPQGLAKRILVWSQKWRCQNLPCQEKCFWCNRSRCWFPWWSDAAPAIEIFSCAETSTPAARTSYSAPSLSLSLQQAPIDATQWTRLWTCYFHRSSKRSQVCSRSFWSSRGLTARLHLSLENGFWGRSNGWRRPRGSRRRATHW